MSQSCEVEMNDPPLITVKEETAPLTNISNGPGAASFCNDQHHRKLAICSIICGISCIGIKALINSVKAETTKNPNAAAPFLKRAKKFGIISIVAWVSILVLTPVLMVLFSYLLTLGD